MIKRKNSLIVLFILLIIIITGCTKSNSDALKFKEEFERLNDTLTIVNIDENNPFIYKTHDEIIKNLENEKAFVVFYANSKDDNSRKLVEKLINSAKSNNLKTIYYVKMEENESNDLLSLKVENIPLIVSVIRGNIDLYTSEEDKIDSIINNVVTELNSCDINVGC